MKSTESGSQETPTSGPIMAGKPAHKGMGHLFMVAGAFGRGIPNDLYACFMIDPGMRIEPLNNGKIEIMPFRNNMPVMITDPITGISSRYVEYIDYPAAPGGLCIHFVGGHVMPGATFRLKVACWTPTSSDGRNCTTESIGAPIGGFAGVTIEVNLNQILAAADAAARTNGGGGGGGGGMRPLCFGG